MRSEMKKHKTTKKGSWDQEIDARALLTLEFDSDSYHIYTHCFENQYIVHEYDESIAIVILAANSIELLRHVSIRFFLNK